MGWAALHTPLNNPSRPLLQGRTVSVRVGQGPAQVVPFDLLVGADGAFSQVRRRLPIIMLLQYPCCCSARAATVPVLLLLLAAVIPPSHLSPRTLGHPPIPAHLVVSRGHLPTAASHGNPT